MRSLLVMSSGAPTNELLVMISLFVMSSGAPTIELLVMISSGYLGEDEGIPIEEEVELSFAGKLVG